jgi:hypothetical protein
MPLKPTTAMRKDRAAGQHVKLQHRHFAFIASVIAGLPDHAASFRAQKASVATAFAEALAKTNPNFDRATVLYCRRLGRPCSRAGGLSGLRAGSAERR